MQIIVTASAAMAGLGTGALVAGEIVRLYPGGASSAHVGARRGLRLGLLSVATAVLFAAASLRASNLTQFLLLSLFGVALLALTATDFERHLLPNRVMYPCLLAALVLSWAWPHRPPLSGLEGGVTGALVMLAVFLVLPGFGFGDVKLAGLIGLVLGFPGVLSGLLVGMILGGVGAGWLLLSKRAGMRTAIAYGPYLAGGAILEMLIRR